jgi:hypothetical protein
MTYACPACHKPDAIIEEYANQLPWELPGTRPHGVQVAGSITCGCSFGGSLAFSYGHRRTYPARCKLSLVALQAAEAVKGGIRTG